MFWLLSLAWVTSFLRLTFWDLMRRTSSTSLVFACVNLSISCLREEESASREVAHFWRALTRPSATPSPSESCLGDLSHWERSSLSPEIRGRMQMRAKMCLKMKLYLKVQWSEYFVPYDHVGVICLGWKWHNNNELQYCLLVSIW